MENKKSAKDTWEKPELKTLSFKKTLSGDLPKTYESFPAYTYRS